LDRNNPWLDRFGYASGGNRTAGDGGGQSGNNGGNQPPPNPPPQGENSGENHYRRQWLLGRLSLMVALAALAVALLGATLTSLGVAFTFLANQDKIIPNTRHNVDTVLAPFDVSTGGRKNAPDPLTPPNPAPTPSQEYVPRTEFEQRMNEQKLRENARLQQLQRKIDRSQQILASGGRGIQKGDATWVPVPFSWTQPDLDQHLSAWARACHVTEQRITETSALYGERCALNGGCLIVSKRCAKGAFDDVDATSGTPSPRVN
jgi:hypothetical protein